MNNMNSIHTKSELRDTMLLLNEQLNDLLTWDAYNGDTYALELSRLKSAAQDLWESLEQNKKI